MCVGIAITYSGLPVTLCDQIPSRVVEREGCRELRFLVRDRPPLLPVIWQGRIELMRWGSQARNNSLPHGFWLSAEWLASGALDWAQPERAAVPANMGLDGGTWYLINEGIVAVVLPHVDGGPVAYVLTEPSTNYYRNMTGQRPTMPVFIGQTI